VLQKSDVVDQANPDMVVYPEIDTNMLDLCLLNDYLNGYKEKLSLGAPKDGNIISVDQQDYANFKKEAEQLKGDPMEKLKDGMKISRDLSKQIYKIHNSKFIYNQLK
jgi:hypothetical protein